MPERGGVLRLSVYAALPGQNICITFMQRRLNVFDVGPTLYKCYTNVLCLLGKYCTCKDTAPLRRKARDIHVSAMYV